MGCYSDFWQGASVIKNAGYGNSLSQFVAAVQANEEGYPIAMRLAQVNGFRSEEIKRWAEKHLASDCHVV
ncbi:MAG: hypothetical protein KZQ81_05060 [Candidatus Thiodiazotropha sp. (ex Rostrolucina anterorostrata)]|nr:hypothetical protein [Candidatus Thiodiazotropha sp. (ex Rostrolucina anterorostrata)]